MGKKSFKSPDLDLFQSVMAEASAGFELDCRQACRGLRVSMAVNVFGIGTILPNNLSPQQNDYQWIGSRSKPDTVHSGESRQTTNFSRGLDNARRAQNVVLHIPESFSQ
ncbi:hypothetical protein [Pseudomonas sp. NPDC086251]|uniref:hypothetical protein n=1 Tax=Pseudomonas sp. NPDC086251 TaxID=3364431 RepID=UPI003838B37F